MKRKIAIISVLFVIILVSCTAAETRVPTEAIVLENMDPATAFAYLAEDIDIGDGGLLSSLPCASPCTFGVHIGETQLDQVIPVLENNGISRCWTEPNVSWSMISCGGNRLEVQVNMLTGLVNVIEFDPSVPISLGDIIEKYGEPNYATVEQGVTRNLQPRLYWNSIRMLVVVPEIFGETYDIRNTTEVERIIFSDEDIYRTSEKESFNPWIGYGMYQPTEPFPLNSTPIATTTPTPAAQFGAADPRLKLLLGKSLEKPYPQPPSVHELFGYAVHRVLPARFCIERGRYWQAEYWISAARGYALSLACHNDVQELANKIKPQLQELTLAWAE